MCPDNLPGLPYEVPCTDLIASLVGSAVSFKEFM